MEANTINTGDTFLTTNGENSETVRSILGVLGVRPQAELVIQPQAQTQRQARATTQAQALAIQPQAQAIQPQTSAASGEKSLGMEAEPEASRDRASGWSKFYSRKTGRAYWFNGNTGEQN